jgi:hypothetical protein
MPNPTDSTNPLTDARGGQGILLSASDPGVLVQVWLRTPSGPWRYRDRLRPVDWSFNRPPPAFIDPPGPFASLEEWESFRVDLEQAQRNGLPHLGRLLREAAREIARRRKPVDDALEGKA